MPSDTPLKGILKPCSREEISERLRQSREAGNVCELHWSELPEKEQEWFRQKELELDLKEVINESKTDCSN